MRPSAGIGVVECKNSRFFVFFDMPARPSAEIGVVEVQKLEVFTCFHIPARPSAGMGMVEVQKLGDRRGRGAKTRGDFFAFLAAPARPSTGTVRIEALSLWRRAILLLAKWPLDPAVAGSIPPWSAAAPAGKSQLLSTNVVRGAHSRSSGWKIATFKYKNSTRSTFPQLRQHLRRATCAESLAQSHLHRALAQSTCAEQLAQSTCAEQLAQSTCVQQLAENNLRAAAWNIAACADHFREKSRGAVRAKHIAPSRLVQSQLAQSQLRRATREK